MTEEERQDLRLKLDKRKQDLEDAKHADEKSGVRFWAPLMLPIAVTLCTLFVSTMAKCTEEAGQVEQTKRDKYAQDQATARAESERKQQIYLANGRDAATMYFDKVGAIRTKENLTVNEKKRYANELGLIASLSGNEDISRQLLEMVQDVSGEKMDGGRGPGTPDVPGIQENTPADAVRGLPDLVAGPASAGYQAATFLAFPQVPKDLYDPLGIRLHAALGTLAFNVQNIERMENDKSPDHNEVRYYRADQRPFAVATAAKLCEALHLQFRARPLPSGGGGLPNGVMEFWIGKENLPGRLSASASKPDCLHID